MTTFMFKSSSSKGGSKKVFGMRTRRQCYKTFTVTNNETIITAILLVFVVKINWQEEQVCVIIKTSMSNVYITKNLQKELLSDWMKINTSLKNCNVYIPNNGWEHHFAFWFHLSILSFLIWFNWLILFCLWYVPNQIKN